MTEPFILWENIIADGVTATDTFAGSSIDNIYDQRDSTEWVAASFGTKYITMDAGAAVAVDSLAILGHNLGTASATISLESSTTGAWGGEEVEQIAGFAPTTDLAICKIFTPATIRYWRVKIITAAITPQIAILNLSSAMDFPVYPDVPFTPLSEGMNVTAEIGKSGHLLGVTTYYAPITIDVSFNTPPMSFVDGDFNTFWTSHGRLSKPFFWVPNITQWANKIYYVRFPANFKLAPPQSDVTYADVLRLKFEGIAE